MSKPKNMKIIGVCGASASGKSTLCTHLNNHFGGTKAPHEVISMDRFQNVNAAIRHSKTNKQIEQELQHEKFGINWEHPVLYDPQALRKHLELLFERHKCDKECYIFVEGFLLFHYDELLDLFDVKIFLDGNSDEFRHRRMTRSRNRCTKDMWDELIHPEYEKRKGVMINRADFVLDATTTIEQVVQQAIGSVSTSSPKTVAL